MEKKVEKSNDDIYQVMIDEYESSIMDDSAKKIFINGKRIGLSVGSQVSWDNGMKSSLLIDVHYDSNHSETLTEHIPQLKSFDNKVAINPSFKNKEIIKKLKELNILSNTIDIINYKRKKYEIVKVNIEELKLYKPFGDTILKDFKDKDIEKIEDRRRDYVE